MKQKSPEVLLRVGRNIELYRKHRKLEQAQLAKLVDKTQPRISELEKGKTNARISTLVEIANALDKDIKDLFEAGGKK